MQRTLGCGRRSTRRRSAVESRSVAAGLARDVVGRLGRRRTTLVGPHV